MKKPFLLTTLVLTGALLTPTMLVTAPAEAAVAAVSAAQAKPKNLTTVTLKVVKKNNRPYLTVKGNAKTTSKKLPLQIRNAVTKKVIRACTVVTKCSTYLGAQVVRVYATWGKKKSRVYTIPVSTTTQTRTTLPAVLREDAKDATQTLKDLPKNPAVQLAEAAKREYSAVDIRRALPTGTVITPNTNSWVEQVGYGTGTMRITIKRPGQQAKTYLAVMVQDDSGNWKFLTTVEAN